MPLFDKEAAAALVQRGNDFEFCLGEFEAIDVVFAVCIGVGQQNHGGGLLNQCGRNVAAQGVDEIVISIGINSAKKTYFSLEERVASIEQLYRSDPRVKVMLYDSLTVDFAKRIDARFILRGIHTINNFEYKKYMADVNRELTSMWFKSFINPS